MQLKGKALFNLLRINWLEDRNMQVKPWAVEDLRDFDIQELFSRLKKLGLILDEKGFYLYAENCDTPEELAECLALEEEDPEKFDQAYLLLFEIWRRLCPEKIGLSVFCDELDQLIELYDSDDLENEEPLQNALIILEDILDEGADSEGDSKKVFSEVSLYCAHDLEGFLFDYITDQIEAQNATYASELIDDFCEFVSDKRRFDVLRARLFALSDIPESKLLYGRILEDLDEDPDLELLLAVVESLVRHGDITLFMLAVKRALPLLKTEEEFQSLLTLVAEYFRCLDRETDEKAVSAFLESRSAHALDKALDHADKTYLHFSKLIHTHVL
ncbi:MAG: hypothetical protein HYX67_13225 [Candidatus Melainabacteria bacterium]|nr:hypothetical protein [Candidatus Melainabacteria bacterium]